MSFLVKAKLHLSTLILVCLVVGLGVFVARKASEEKGSSNLPGKASQAKSSNLLRPGATRDPASRGPASIQRVFDYSYLQGDALQMAAKSRLLSSLSVSRSEHDSVIEIGNFVVLNDASQKDFACGYYDQVAMTFTAEGVAVDGERPELSVRTGCQVGDNINSFEPIRVPVEKLLGMEPGNAEYKFFESKNPVTVQFSHSLSQWPKKWQLTELKMTNSQYTSRVLHLTSDDFQQSGKVMMNW